MTIRANWIWVAMVLVAGPALAADEQIIWQTDIAKAVQQAKEEKKLVLVHFYGDTCKPCRAVDQKVFPEPKVVQSVMRNYVPVKINVDKEEKIADHYAVRQIPMDVFLVGGTGQEAYRAVTKESATEYATLLDNYAIQTGVGGARQASLREREARYDLQQTAAEQPAQAEQQYVQNQYAAQNGNGNNRYTQQPVAQPQQPVAGQPQPEVQTVFRAPPAASQPAQPQAGPVNSQPPQQPAQPGAIQGFVPQGNKAARPSQPTTQRATYQDPGDITARPPIRTQFIPRENLPPLGLEGFCPVSVSPPGPKQEGAWKKGDPRFGAVHRGRTYLFHSAAEQAKFLADPDAYSPVLSGADPVILAETGKLVEGKRLLGVAISVGGRNEIYLFATPENRERFEQNQQRYATAAHQAVLKGDTDRKLP